MAVRQYIGARYVTKIYENSVNPGSAEWESGVTYEPLTLVTYQYSSYLSKKEVPGTIGDPASNPAYWVITGAYNGQIATLQSEIDNILDIKIYDDKHRSFIFQGDSFDTLHAHGWSEYAASHIGCDYSVVCSGGGYGFEPAPTSPNFGKHWIDLLIADQTIDDDKITDICICGGSNDKSNTYTNLLAAATTYDTYVRQRFKNLKNIYLGYVGFDYTTPTEAGQVNDGVMNYRNIALNLGWNFLDGVQYICRNPQNMMPDNLHHLTAAAVPVLGRYIAQCVKQGSVEYQNISTTGFTADSSKFTAGSQNFNIVFEIRGGILKAYSQSKLFTAATALSGTIPNIFTSNMRNYIERSLGINIWLRWGGNWHPAQLKCNSSDMNNLDLVLLESDVTIAANTPVFFAEQYNTILL